MTFTTNAPADVAVVPKRKLGRFAKVGLGVLVVLLVLALVGIVRNYFADKTPPAAVEVAAPVIANPAPVIPDTGVCSAFPAADPAAPLTYSPVTAWSRDGGTSLPSEQSSGPAFATPFSWCFAHTATGALFAAANYAGQMRNGTMTPAKEITLAQYAASDDANRQAILGQWTLAGTQPLAGGSAGNYSIAPAQFVAFHFTEYAADRATIEIANTWNDRLSAVTYTLTWESGDWKVVLPADGRFPTRDVMTPIDSTWFTKWSAVGAG